MLAECTELEKQLRYEGIIEKRLDELKNMLEELFLYTKLTSEVFRNLINNALMHGTNELCIVQTGTALVFTNPVKDDRLDTEKIFERFYKADKTRQKGFSGLGLSIVKELVERIGGTIDAAMDNGNRLAITITFLSAKASETCHHVS